MKSKRSFANKEIWLGKLDVGMKDLVASSTKYPKASGLLPGEWTGPDNPSSRRSTTDPVVALAEFIAGTTQHGCGCDDCHDRRLIVAQLIYSNIDEEQLCDTIFGAPLPPKKRRAKNGQRRQEDRKRPQWLGQRRRKREGKNK